jgi:hypothetical protein
MQALFDLLYNLVVIPFGIALFFLFDMAVVLITLLYLNRLIEWLLARR